MSKKFKKKITEQTVINEIKKNLEEQFIFVYESGDEQAFADFVTNLTEEQIELLGLNEADLKQLAIQKVGELTGKTFSKIRPNLGSRIDPTKHFKSTKLPGPEMNPPGFKSLNVPSSTGSSTSTALDMSKLSGGKFPAPPTLPQPKSSSIIPKVIRDNPGKTALTVGAVGYAAKKAYDATKSTPKSDDFEAPGRVTDAERAAAKKEMQDNPAKQTPGGGSIANTVGEPGAQGTPETTSPVLKTPDKSEKKSETPTTADTTTDSSSGSGGAPKTSNVPRRSNGGGLRDSDRWGGSLSTHGLFKAPWDMEESIQHTKSNALKEGNWEKHKDFSKLLNRIMNNSIKEESATMPERGHGIQPGSFGRVTNKLKSLIPNPGTVFSTVAPMLATGAVSGGLATVPFSATPANAGEDEGLKTDKLIRNINKSQNLRDIAYGRKQLVGRGKLADIKPETTSSVTQTKNNSDPTSVPSGGIFDKEPGQIDPNLKDGKPRIPGGGDGPAPKQSQTGLDNPPQQKQPESPPFTASTSPKETEYDYGSAGKTTIVHNTPEKAGYKLYQSPEVVANKSNKMNEQKQYSIKDFKMLQEKNMRKTYEPY